MSTRTTMTTTMFGTRTGTTSLTNGNGSLAETQKATPARFWSKIRMTEWTFSLSLLALSLAIVLGKLYVNYGRPLSWQIGNRYSPMFSQMYETIPSISMLSKFDMDNEGLLSASNQYAGATVNGLITFHGKYGWLLRAMISGLALTSFSWFIVYKDSRIPGVNPPFPFSPSRQRIGERSGIHMNYLVGILNGIFCFIYMCL
ncbi:uncharacterized protein LOC105426670 [Pogonomyrmex barbatus]|uniref:Uncharacterized protein LOC105426670 n=1 Tax=Pogonomyrmex barbatus TaxID=144034 RepID=A0A6I9W4K5_9HYME|nr:uncharacterized protein LOC105426670 [Pogonomyrmex barbatus]